MKLLQFLKSPAYRRAWRKERAINEISKRHKAVEHHVYVQTVFYFTETEWKKKYWLTVDGLRLIEYHDNVADQHLLETLRHRYYVLHRHTILKRMY